MPLEGNEEGENDGSREFKALQITLSFDKVRWESLRTLNGRVTRSVRFSKNRSGS